jgi:hypothetical protein
MLVPSVVIPLALALVSAAQPRAREWEWGCWVITASIDAEAGDLPSATADVAHKVERCGYVTFDDFSAKFVLFERGYRVVVVGPFELQSAAELARKRIEPCVPDAYVKFGGYLGR